MTTLAQYTAKIRTQSMTSLRQLPPKHHTPQRMDKRTTQPTQPHHPTQPTDNHMAIWPDHTYERYIAARHVDLIIQFTTSYETAAFSWILYANHRTPIVLTQMAACTPDLYAATNRTLLLAISHCLTNVTHEHHIRHLPHPNRLLAIWLPCAKTIRRCQTFRHQFHTAASSMKEESELVGE